MRNSGVVALWAGLLAYLGLIFYVSHLPRPSAPVVVSDKILHALEYAVLAVLAILAFHRGTLRLRAGPAAAAVLFTVLYGMSDEIHQAFVPGRHASVADVVADAVGAIAAAIGLALTHRWVRTRSAGRPRRGEDGSVL